MTAQIVKLPEALARFAEVVIDTCVLIDDYRQLADSVVDQVPVASRRTAATSLFEFLRGPASAVLGANERARHRRWLRDKQILPLRERAGVEAALLHLLEARRAPPPVGDALIAAHCLVRRLPLVTRNVRDFEPIDNLVVVSV